MSPETDESSIIKIIQRMVSDGESEEKIVQTLRDLGVDEDKAKRLLLLGQADTFALLRSEISKIVKEDLDKQKPEMKKFISSEAEKAGGQVRRNVWEELKKDAENYEKDLSNK